MKMNQCTMTRAILAGAALCAFAPSAHAAGCAIVGFRDGAPRGFTGNAYFQPAGGNPAGAAHFLIENVGIELRTGGVGEPINPRFIGDYSGFDSVTLGFDVIVESLAFGGSEIAREIGVELLDHDVQGPDGPAGVYFLLDYLSLATHGDWTRLSVTIDNPTQSDLPPGWIGFGDYDPVTFEPRLPPGATFASVLASADEFRVTSYQPGWFYGFTDFNVRVDNIFVQPRPCR
jgi:hypothetical protein